MKSTLAILFFIRTEKLLKSGKAPIYLRVTVNHHLRTVRKCNNNSAVKYLRLFKRVTSLALRNEWMAKDPFKNFTMKLNEVKRGFLTNEELRACPNYSFEYEN